MQAVATVKIGGGGGQGYGRRKGIIFGRGDDITGGNKLNTFKMAGRCTIHFHGQG